ncbi:hypothetical protein ACS0TY_010177 [Phlomoides rotata]
MEINYVKCLALMLLVFLIVYGSSTRKASVEGRNRRFQKSNVDGLNRKVIGVKSKRVKVLAPPSPKHSVPIRNGGSPAPTY